MQETADFQLLPYYDVFSECMTRSYKRTHPFSDKKKNRSYSKKILKGAAVTTAIAACLCGGTVYAAQNVIVTDVFVEDRIERVYSFSSAPESIVEKAGYSLAPEDSVLLDYFSGEGEDNVILVLKPCPVKLYRDGEYLGTVTLSGTVRDILEKSGIILDSGDSINLPMNEAITEATSIEITSGFPVTVKYGEKKEVYGFAGGTVKELLDKYEIEYDSDDIIKPSLDTKLKKKSTVTVKAVEYKEETETVKTDFTKEVQYSADLYEDESKVTQKGKKGEEKIYYRVKYVDGKRKEATEVRREAIVEPKAQITSVGTKKRPRNYVYGTRVFSEIEPPYEIELDENNRPVNYKKIITGKATAYCGGGITATGAAAMPGRIAVNPKQIPYGTKMYVVSSDGKYVYGYCIASDTGGFVKKKSAIADLYMHSYDDCMQFGRRNVDIYILE